MGLKHPQVGDDTRIHLKERLRSESFPHLQCEFSSCSHIAHEMHICRSRAAGSPQPSASSHRFSSLVAFLRPYEGQFLPV